MLRFDIAQTIRIILKNVLLNGSLSDIDRTRNLSKHLKALIKEATHSQGKGPEKRDQDFINAIMLLARSTARPIIEAQDMKRSIRGRITYYQLLKLQLKAQLGIFNPNFEAECAALTHEMIEKPVMFNIPLVSSVDKGLDADLLDVVDEWAETETRIVTRKERPEAKSLLDRIEELTNELERARNEGRAEGYAEGRSERRSEGRAEGAERRGERWNERFVDGAEGERRSNGENEESRALFRELSNSDTGTGTVLKKTVLELLNIRLGKAFENKLELKRSLTMRLGTVNPEQLKLFNITDIQNKMVAEIQRQRQKEREMKPKGGF